MSVRPSSLVSGARGHPSGPAHPGAVRPRLEGQIAGHLQGSSGDRNCLVNRQLVSAVAGGRILNPKPARRQVRGAVVSGRGVAREEESVLDHAFGRFVTHSLADYHVPVNADVHDIEVIFVEEEDRVVNPLGAKGLGEIGIVGVAAAIANAVYHATGKRVRDLPITPDKLL